MKHKIFFIILTLFSINKYSVAEEEHNHSAHSNKPFYGHFEMRLHVDHISDAEEGEEEVNEIYTHSHIEFGSKVYRNLNIDAYIKVEGEPAGHSHGGVTRSHDGDSRFFEDHPVIVESLTVKYSHKHFSAYAGKFNPKVGLDYHSFPGLYSYSMIEKYKIAERIGVGLEYSSNFKDYGIHKFNISTFFADTTFLSDAIVDQRGHTSKKDGELANTEDFDSYAISIGGKDFYSLENNFAERIFYRLGYALQKKGINNDNDETRYSISLGYKENFDSHISKTIIFEYMDINHYNGEAGHDRSYFTSSLGLNLFPWNFSATYTFVDNIADEDAEGADGKFLQISIGYSLSEKLSLSFGFKRTDEELEVTERFGLGLRYSYEL